MLASPSVKPNEAKLPAYISTKIDGIRAITTADGPRTRTLKPIPNEHIASMLSQLEPGYDGELVVLDENGVADFRGTEKAVMRREGTPKFYYFIFDTFNEPTYAFKDRYEPLRHWHKPPPFVKIVEQSYVETADELAYMYEAAVSQGHEGLIGRSPDAPYKFGRATPKSGHMYKLKPIEDAEGIVVGITEMMHNENPATIDALGHTKRSSAKAGKVPAGVMGTLVVESAKWPGVQFEVGTGYSADDRLDMWVIPPIGRTITFSYAATGGYDRPRSASFKGFRDEDV